MGSGQPGATSFMEDYTYHLGPGEPKILGAHMLEVCPSIAAGDTALRDPPLGIGNRSDPVRLVFDALPGKGFVVDSSTLATGSGSSRTRSRSCLLTRRSPSSQWRGPSGKPAPSLSTSTESWLMAAARTTPP